MTIKIEFEPQLLVHTTEQQSQEDLLFSTLAFYEDRLLLEYFEQQQAEEEEDDDDDDEVSTLLNSLLDYDDYDDDSTINSQELSCLLDDYDDCIHTLDCSWNDIDFPTRRRNGPSTLGRRNRTRRPSNERLEELRREIEFDRFLLDGIELQQANTEQDVERSECDADIAVTEECEEDDGFPKDSVRLGQRRLPGASYDKSRHLSNIIDIPKQFQQLNDAYNDNGECHIDICCYLNDIVVIEDDVKPSINHSP